MDNKTVLLILMIVLIALVVLLAVLGIVFTLALRKRRPVIKVVMPPQTAQGEQPEEEAEEEESEERPAPVVAPTPAPVVAAAEATEPAKESTPAPAPEPVPVETEQEEEEDEDEAPEYVTEGQERVRYNRSLTARLHQLSDKSKEWYSQLKNELLSYEKVKVRMSWKRETFRIGRMTVAKFLVRGKTLCILFAVEPASFDGTKFSVRDVSNIASMADTPTMYRVRKDRRCKYAKEMIADIMKELKVYKKSHYEPQDYFLPYEGDMSLMQRGLVKRVVSGTTRTFRIEEVSSEEAAKAEQAKSEAAATNNDTGE